MVNEIDISPFMESLIYSFESWVFYVISGASKLASTYFTLFYRSVHVLYTGLGIMFKVNFEIIYPKLLNIFLSCVVSRSH